jgi:hypothetical protein
MIEVDKLAREQATLAPSFIGVLSRVDLGLSAGAVHRTGRLFAK